MMNQSYMHLIILETTLICILCFALQNIYQIYIIDPYHSADIITSSILRRLQAEYTAWRLKQS